MTSAPRSRVRRRGGLLLLTALCFTAAAGAVGLGGALGNAKRTIGLLQTPPSVSADPRDSAPSTP